MLGKHPSSKQGHGKVSTCSNGSSSVIVVKNSVALGRRYGGGKELIESIFTELERGTAVLGSCCVSSAWSSHSVGENCACFVLEQPRTGARGAVRVSGVPEPVLLLCSARGCHPSSHVTAWAPPRSLIAAPVSVSEMQRWNVSPKNGHSGSDDVLPVVLSHHHLLFVSDK